MQGRYGPYVTDGVTNASLPRGTSPEEVTFEYALNLLAERAAAGPSKRAARQETGEEARRQSRQAREEAGEESRRQGRETQGEAGARLVVGWDQRSAVPPSPEGTTGNSQGR